MENKPSVMAEYDKKRRLYQSFASEIEHQLRNILDAEGIIYNAVTSRLKDRESLSKKIDRKDDKYAALGDLTDIAGVRIITYYTEDVDKVAKIVEQEYLVDKENSIDKRDALEPDRFGYCSVHYVVEMSQERLRLREYQEFDGLKCEIQIRSVLQHAWAEIEHDLGYKSEVAIPKNIRRNFSRLAGLLELADKEFQEIRSFLQHYQNEVEDRMEQTEMQNAEIDAVLLDTIIRKDSDFIEICEELEHLWDTHLATNISSESVDRIIKRLHWLGIYTIGQLREAIGKNKENVIVVANEIHGPEHSENDPVAKWAVYLYLCYTELLINDPDYDRIVQYLAETSADVPDEQSLQGMARFLLQIAKKLKIAE